MNDKTIGIYRTVLIALNVFISIVIVACHYEFKETDYMETIYDVITLVSIFLIIIGEIFFLVEQKLIVFKCLKEDIFPDGRVSTKSYIIDVFKAIEGNLIGNNLPPKKVNSSTIELRNKSRIKIILAVICCVSITIIICILLGVQYLFCSIACISILIGIFFDFFMHVRRYAIKYDKRFVGEEKACVSRGLARLYFDEYVKTNFNRNDEFYEQIYYNEHCNECKKHILTMSVDRENNIGLVFSGISLFLNIMFLFPVTEKFVINAINITSYRDKGEFIYNMMYLIIIVGTAALNVYSCRQSEAIERSTKKALMTYIENNTVFKNKYNKNKSLFNELDLYRGIFQYSMDCLDHFNESNNGELISDIPWQDRMLFVHRRYTHVPRLRFAVVLISLAVFFFLMHMWGWCWYYLILFPIAIVVYKVLYHKYLPVAGQKKIIKWCEILQNNNI